MAEADETTTNQLTKRDELSHDQHRVRVIWQILLYQTCLRPITHQLLHQLGGWPGTIWNLWRPVVSANVSAAMVLHHVLNHHTTNMNMYEQSSTIQ